MQNIVSKEIITENPINELWKQLRLLLDKNLVINKIIDFQKITDKKKHIKNIEKQATQIGYCILQAEEYFNAAKNVSIATKPILVYYGSVCLSKALILLKKDGTFSFDYLRKEDKHKHHGLEMTMKFKDVNLKKIDTLDFLKKLECYIYLKKNIPWGNFPIFYDVLNPEYVRIDRETRFEGTIYRTKGVNTQYSIDKIPISNIIKKKFNALFLIKNLPDMYELLEQLKYDSYLLEGNCNIGIMRHADEEINNEIKNKITEIYNFFIRNKETFNIATLLKYYQERNNKIEITSLEKKTFTHLKIMNQYYNTEIEDIPYSFLPDMIDDINNKIFYISNYKEYIYETANFMITLFLFSMISRYHPDIWMTALQKNIKIVEIVDTFLNIAIRKFPNLILNQIYDIKFDFKMK